MIFGISTVRLYILFLMLSLSACGGGGGNNTNSSINNSVVSSTNSSINSSIASSTENNSSSIAESSANSSAFSSSNSSEDTLPIVTPPDLVNVTILNLIQDQLLNISLDNIGGKNLTKCSSDLPNSFKVTVSSDATTCEISGEASELISLTSFTVTAVNADGSDAAQVAIQIQAATPFVTTWKTDNEGSSAINQITITTSPNFNYHYTINWGDGSTNENVTGDITHTYTAPGEYKISINGRFPQTYFNAAEDTTDAAKLLSVDAWGNRFWLSMELAFAGAKNLVIKDSQAPNLSRVSSMLGTFAEAVDFNSDISHWDVSNVTDMTGTFFSSESFNGDLNRWNVSHVKNMSFMFNGAANFNGDISSWEVSNVTTMTQMFANAHRFNQNISTWDIANVTDFSSMFEDARAFNQNLGSWNISKATSINFFATNSGLSIENYDALLMGWSVLPLQKNLILDVSPTQYSTAAEAAHTILTDTFGWEVFDGGLLTLPDLQGQTLKLQTNSAAKISIDNSGGKPDSCVADALPNGLSVQVAGNTCEIVGAPTTPQPATTFTITATNILGNSSARITLTIEAQTPFITIWKTDNPGISDDNQITMLTAPGLSYNYRIEWGDGSVNENVTSDITHTYASPGTYTVSITGTFPQPFFKATFDATQTDSQKILSVEQWGNRPWRAMNQAFFDCRNLTINDIKSPDLSQVTNMNSMFRNADNLSGNISNWDVSKVSDMGSMFSGADNFDLDISGWDVSNVSNMSGMFGGTKFNRPLGSWNVANVTNMGDMFRGALLFNQDVSNWNTSKVSNMNAMFREAKAFNQPIGNWNVANVTNMGDMFRGALLFNQDVSKWNTSKVSNMNAMFREARAFNQPIGNWNVANVTNMGDMFFAIDLFNADISNWNVSKVTDMSRMFRGTKAFNQNLGNWNVSNVTTMSDLFVAGVLSTGNYNSMLIGWSQLPSLKTGVVLNVGTTKFSATAQIARDTLVNNFGWVITDGGLQP